MFTYLYGHCTTHLIVMVATHLIVMVTTHLIVMVEDTEVADSKNEFMKKTSILIVRTVPIGRQNGDSI